LEVRKKGKDANEVAIIEGKSLRAKQLFSIPKYSKPRFNL
jgi:hypothetical protein